MSNPNLMYRLHELGEERFEKYAPQLIDMFPALADFDEPIILGSHAWVLQRSKMRFILRDKVVRLFDFPQTAPEIARDYLKVYFGGQRRRAFSAQVTAIKYPRSAPLYAEPCIMASAAYVDLKSAYWSILKIVGWDCDYYPDHWLRRGYRPLDFPLPDNKVARNTLVSACLSVKSRKWTGTKIVEWSGENQFINYCLWALVQDMLTIVAQKALELGAQHIHTDGYILPFGKAEKLMSYIDSMGLSSAIKHKGACRIWSIGNWDFMDRRAGLSDKDSPFNNIRMEVDGNFLYKRIVALS